MASIAYILEDAGFTRKQVEALEQSRDRDVATKADLERLRGELKIDISEVKIDIESLRGEVKADIEGLRGELKADIEGLRGELKADIGGLRGELKADIEGLRGELKLIKWMMGFTFAGIISLVLKAFFV